MESKHTKGNWEIFIQPCEKELTRTINVGTKRIATLNYMGTQDESKANAKLIASAPELLAALIPLYTFCDCTPEGIFADAIYKDLQHLVKAAKEAINKATL